MEGAEPRQNAFGICFRRVGASPTEHLLSQSLARAIFRRNHGANKPINVRCFGRQHDIWDRRGTLAVSAQAKLSWRELVAVTAIVVASAVCAPNATAQKNSGPPNALQGFSQNRDEPMKIRAVSLEIREKDKMATFTGDVYVLQGDTEMRCKVLVASYESETGTRTANAAAPGPEGDRQIRWIEAKGDVVVVQKDQKVTGDAATFNMRENTVTLVGNVVVTRGSNVLRSQRLVVDLTSGVSKMDGGRIDGTFQSVRQNPPDPRNEKSSTEK
jgi:lipopolysaccharide export system protein LptA